MKLEFKSSMCVGMSDAISISDIIKRAGGAAAIAAASNGQIKKDAVYKWSLNGIPDRHWPILIGRTGVTAEQLFEANCEVRGVAA